MVVLQSMRAESSRPLRSRLWSLFTALATFQWFRQATRPDEIQGVGETHHLLMEGTVKSHCKEYTYRNGRSYCGHLCKQSTMLHPLVAIIHIPPTCRIDSPPPKTPKVSSNHGIRLDVHFLFVYVQKQMKFLRCSTWDTVSLDAKTWELKRQIICPNTPNI